MNRAAFLMTCLAVVLSLLVGCKKPAPPTITPTSGEVVVANPEGLIIKIHATAHNPHSVALPVKSAQAVVTLGTNVVGDVSTRLNGSLAPNADTPLDFDLVIPWKSMASVLSAFAGDPVPYSADGTAQLEAAGLNFNVPFTYKGSFRRMDAVTAAIRHSGIVKKLANPSSKLNE